MEAVLLPVLFLVFAFLAALGGGRVADLRRRQRGEAYRLAAEELSRSGEGDAVSAVAGPALSGTVAGFVLNTEESVRNNETQVRITVHGRGRIPPALGLERERVPLGLLGGEDVIVGDPAFDAELRVQGGADLALALLGAEARAAVLSLFRSAFSPRLAGGAVVLELSSPADAAGLVAAVRAAVRTAARLIGPEGGLDAALAARATQDPVPGVRLRALETLAVREDAAGMLRDVARRLLADPHPEVRLRAATLLGEEGTETLAALMRVSPPGGVGERGHLWWEIDLPAGRRHELAEILDLSAAGTELRKVRALALLAESSPPARLLPLLREALRGSPRLCEMALRTLARIGDVSFEAEVAQLLHSGSPAVQFAAVAALGTFGTAAVVPALRALAGSSGSLDFRLRRDVDNAVARIHSRLDGAAAGQVSLVDVDAGTADAGGRVTLAGRDAGGEVSIAGAPADAGGRVWLQES